MHGTQDLTLQYNIIYMKLCGGKSNFICRLTFSSSIAASSTIFIDPLLVGLLSWDLNSLTENVISFRLQSQNKALSKTIQPTALDPHALVAKSYWHTGIAAVLKIDGEAPNQV